MKLQLGNTPIIEDLRNHPAVVLRNLRELLAAGAPARPDPRRHGFYEVEAGDEVYYIHLAPERNKVLLVAYWRDAERALAAQHDRAAD